MTALSLTDRLQWVGASEIAALVGASPYQSRFALWHTKAGTLPPEEFETERTLAGQFLEPAIAAWANHKWQWDLVKSVGYTPHPSVPGMGASLDYVVQSTGEPVDIKNVDGLIFKDEWIADGDFVHEAPLHLTLQIQAQIACSGASAGWLVACVAGNRLYRHRIERHDGVIARLETEVAEFWASIREGREPKPDYSMDGPTLAAIYKAGKAGVVADLSQNNRAPVLCAEICSARVAEQAAADRKEAATAELRDLIRDASAVILPGYSVSVSDIKASEYTVTRKAYRRIAVKEKKL